MIASDDQTIWVRRSKPNPDAVVRLFCLPFGGGGAAIFREWPGDLAPSVEVCPIQLPGREARHREPLQTRLGALLPLLGAALLPLLDRPYAIFGHSMGALIAFELARWLRRRGAPEPLHLFTSARRAPHLPDRRSPLHTLPADELVKQLSQRYHGIPRAVLEHPDLLRVFVPIFRADLTLNESYLYIPDAPLACPLSAFGGLDDAEITRDDLAAWGDQTRGSLALRMLPGGHFFLQDERPRLLAALMADLDQTLRDLAQPACDAPPERVTL